MSVGLVQEAEVAVVGRTARERGSGFSPTPARADGGSQAPSSGPPEDREAWGPRAAAGAAAAAAGEAVGVVA